MYKIKKRKQRPERGSYLNKVTQWGPAEPDHSQGSQLPLLGPPPREVQRSETSQTWSVQDLPEVWPSSPILELLKTTDGAA